MKKIMWLVLMPVLLVTGFAGQEKRAPGKGQCEADLAAVMDDGTRNSKSIAELANWVEEFSDCDTAYGTWGKKEYAFAMTRAVTEVMKRQRSFLDRHGFKAQFLKE